MLIVVEMSANLIDLCGHQNIYMSGPLPKPLCTSRSCSIA